MDRSKKAATNLMTAIVLQAVTIVCGFIVPKMIIDNYGSSVNGLVSSITQFLAYITLLEAGFGPVVKALLYKPIAEKDKKTIEGILRASEKFFRRIALVFVLYVCILCFVYPNIVGEFDIPFTVSLLIIMSISTLAEYFFGMTYSIYLQAKQKMYIVSRTQIATLVLNTVLVILLIKMGCSIQIVKLASVFVYILRPLFLNYYVKHKYNLNLKDTKNEATIKQKWDGLSQHIAYVIHSNTDVVVLSVFSGVLEVSVYAVYLLVLNGLKSLMFTIRDSTMSSFGDMMAKGEQENLRKKFSAFELFYHSFITIAYSCALVLIVPFVQVYTNGVTDVDYVRPIFAAIIVIAEFVWAARLPYASLAHANGHFRQTSRGAWIEAGLNLAISIILVNVIGIVGVAIGTLVATLFRTVEFIRYVSKNQLKRNYSKPLLHFTLMMIETLFIFIIGNYFIAGGMTSFVDWGVHAIIVLLIACAVVVTMNLLVFRDDVRVLFGTAKKIIRRNK